MGLRCLIIDDSEEFLASARTLLSVQGMEVVGASTSGIAALQLAEQMQADVALVDVQLGAEDGLELARQLHERVPATSIIIVSTRSRDELLDLIAETPAIGFLDKTSLSAAAIAELIDHGDGLGRDHVTRPTPS